MDPVPFAINHQIFMGFTTLTPEEREAVKAAIAPLMDHPERDWPAHGARDPSTAGGVVSGEGFPAGSRLDCRSHRR